jgi:20S proteasome subunit alpha 5
MFLTRSEYDRGVNTFSPEGRLFQVEYAMEAIKLGSTAVGIQTKEGVILAAEKRITSPLMEPSSIEKILEIDSHVGCAISGLTADARTLVDHARLEAVNHTFSYNEQIPIESVTQAVCDLSLRFGEGVEEGGRGSRKGRRRNGGKNEPMISRPFGVALLVGGMDSIHGPQLYYADPSGTFTRYEAKAIGAGSEGAQQQLQEEYKKDTFSLHDAEILAIKILRQVMEEKMSTSNIEMVSITPDLGYLSYSKERLAPLVSEAHATANATLSASVN